jgi:hypothetical protein
VGASAVSGAIESSGGGVIATGGADEDVVRTAGVVVRVLSFSALSGEEDSFFLSLMSSARASNEVESAALSSVRRGSVIRFHWDSHRAAFGRGASSARACKSTAHWRNSASPGPSGRAELDSLRSQFAKRRSNSAMSLALSL